VDDTARSVSGAHPSSFYCLPAREQGLKIFDNYCGARLTTHAFRIGGLQYELYDGFEEQVNAFCDMFLPKVDEYEELLTNNRIWVARLKGVGILSGDECKEFGVTGPVLRAAGVKWDLRKAQPYSGYEKYEFDIPTRQTGDTFDRYIVRMQELRQSVRIMRQAVEGIPEGPIMGKVGKVIKPPPGEAYVSIEAPKGELGYYVVSDGATQPYRVRVRPPSFVNLQALDRMIRGGPRLNINPDNGETLCISCNLCALACPENLIVVTSMRNEETKRKDLVTFIYDTSRCMFCGLCEDACPVDALELTQDFEMATYT